MGKLITTMSAAASGKSRLTLLVIALCLVAVTLVLTASRPADPAYGTALASFLDFDLEIEKIFLSKSVKAGDTADIKVRCQNLSSSDGVMDGDATFDMRLVVTSPSGRVWTYPWDNLYLEYAESLDGIVEDFHFEEEGTYRFQAEIYTVLGFEYGWTTQRYDTFYGTYNVEPAAPEWDASVEEISLSESVNAGQTADLEMRVENLAREDGPYSGYATYDMLLKVTAPSGEEFFKEWDNIELGYREEITLKWEDFLFREAGRYRFLAEVHDIRGKQESWDSDHRLDRWTGSYTVSESGPVYDAEVKSIRLSGPVSAGQAADIRVVVENQSEKRGPHDGTGIFDLLLEWTSPSGRTYSRQWDNLEYPYREEVTQEVEDIVFDEEGRWRFQARIYGPDGLQSGWDLDHRFDSHIRRYTVEEEEEADPTWDARVNSIRISQSGGSIEADFQNLSDKEGRFDVSIKVTSPSGQTVRYTYNDQFFEYNEFRTFSLSHGFDESGLHSVQAEIFDNRGMEENWNTAHRFDSMTRSSRVTIATDSVDLCPVVTLEGGKNPWLLKLMVDGEERQLNSEGCLKLAGDTGSGRFGEGEYLLEVKHPGYLPATLLVYLVEGDPAVYPEARLVYGDIDGDGFVGPGDIDLNRDGVITEVDATLLVGSGLADFDDDGDVLLGTDVLTLVRNLGRTHSPTLVVCQMLYSDETPQNPDDPIDWSVGGCTEADVEEVTSWLQTFSNAADTANLVACGIFVGNIILAIIPPTSPSAVALPVTGAACFATGVAATGLAIAEFSTRNDGENITKLLEGDPEAMKEGGFILGVGALDFVGAGSVSRIGVKGTGVSGKIGLKSTVDGVEVSKTYSLEPLEAVVRSKKVNRRLASALGNQDEAAKLLKNVQGLPAAEQASFYTSVSRAIQLQGDSKLLGLDPFLRGINDQGGAALVSSLRELQVAVGLAQQTRRSASEIVVLGSHELKMNFRSQGNPGKIFSADKQLDVIELGGGSASAVKAARETSLPETLKEGILFEDLLKVHEVTRVEYDVGVQSISDRVMWEKLNRPLTDASLKSKFTDLANARTASNIPELTRVVFLDFVDGKRQRGIGRDTINLIIANAQDHMGRVEYIGADKVLINFLGDATVRVNNIDVPKFVPHILSISAEGTAVSLRQVWNAGVLSADEIGAYNASEFPIELIHGEDDQTGSGGDNSGGSGSGRSGSGGGGNRGGSSGGGGNSGGGGSSGGSNPVGNSGGGSGSGGASGSVGGYSSSTAVPTSTPDDQCTHQITLGSIVNGEWTDSCQSSIRGRGYTRHINFTLPAEAEVTIELVSTVDTYLYLRSGSSTSGVALHSNDDIESGNTNSRVVATLGPGTWTVEATTYREGVVGNFTLSVKAEGDTTATSCTPVVLTLPAVEVAGNWAEDCQSSVPGRGYSVYYDFILDKVAEIAIDVKSSEDTYAILREGDSYEGEALHFNDDRIGGDTDSRIEATLDPGNYRLEVTTYRVDTTGDFTLSVVTGDGTEPPAGTGCTPVVLTLPAVEVAGNWAEDCESSVPGRGYSVYYEFILDQVAEITIDVKSSEDTYAILREGDSFEGEALHFNDDRISGDTDSRIEATLDPGNYRLEVTTYREDTTGDFTLTVSTEGNTTAATGCDATPLELPAVEVAGTWADDCHSEEPGRGYARFYRFTLEEEREVTADLTSSVDTYLYLREDDETGAGTILQENDDLQPRDLNSRIVATLGAGTYVLEATTYEEDQPGDFVLSVN